MSFHMPSPSEFATFKTWSANYLLPQVYRATRGAPGENSMQQIFRHYSSITSTPSGLGVGVPNEFVGHEEMMKGFLLMVSETYFTEVCGSQQGPYEVSMVKGKTERKTEGMVEGKTEGKVEGKKEGKGNEKEEGNEKEGNEKEESNEKEGKKKEEGKEKKKENDDEGVVVVECIKVVGGVKKVVAAWRFVRKTG